MANKNSEIKTSGKIATNGASLINAISAFWATSVFKTFTSSLQQSFFFLVPKRLQVSLEEAEETKIWSKQ